MAGIFVKKINKNTTAYTARSLFFLFALWLLAAAVCSCAEQPQIVQFPVRGTSVSLSALTRQAASGSIDFSKSKTAEYHFERPPVFSVPVSLEIEYMVNSPQPAAGNQPYQIVLETGGQSWALPLDSSFIGLAGPAAEVLHYAIPLEPSAAGRFTIALLEQEGTTAIRPALTIHSLEFKERWFGFYTRGSGNSPVKIHCFATPFVSVKQGTMVIDPPPAAVPAGFLPELALVPAGKAARLSAGNFVFEAATELDRLIIPAEMLVTGGLPAVSGERSAFTLIFRRQPALQAAVPQPINADPGMILAWPVKNWRSRRYELFRWEQFQPLLIFDFADYAVQDRFLKRLAFFVEKAGFRGRLAPDAEIADLHGWNAHDYRAADLARFFETARAANFPLLTEERELEQILIENGIIVRSGGSIGSGEGGIISVTRESTAYQRSLFMAHEGFHGIFFIDEDFREFSRRRWEGLSTGAKRFIVSYFDYQHYDTSDGYLMVNEFMAHILQQPVSQAGRYFGETLASRIDASSWRRAVLPAKDSASNSWPSLAAAFSAEAVAFSAYVKSRWGLAAGQVHRVTVR